MIKLNSKTAAPSHAFNDTSGSDQYRKPSMLFFFFFYETKHAILKLGKGSDINIFIASI